MFTVGLGRFAVAVMGALALVCGLVVANPVLAFAAPSWTVSTSPGTGSSFNYLNGVSCASGTMCKAVGDAQNVEGFDRTLIESWNGHTWSHSFSPDVGNYEVDNDLNGVSCISATWCMAVGEQGSTVRGSRDVPGTLIEMWNGTKWSITPSPPNETLLSGVSCVTASWCIAVGESPAGAGQTLIESWNGSTWAVSSSPNENANQDYLFGVSCVSTTSCQAAGSYNNGNQSLIESWNGSTWAISTTPIDSSGFTGLGGVSCVSATSCKAVGVSVNRTLVLSWNGSTWSRSSTPNNGSGSNALGSVSCVSTTSCKAVGWYDNGSTSRTLIESWNGTKWSLQASPNDGTGTNTLGGVSCVSATSCKAVGDYYNRPSNLTLIESYG